MTTLPVGNVSLTTDTDVSVRPAGRTGEVMVAALLLGALGDLLLRVGPPGLNLSLFAVEVVTAVLVLRMRAEEVQGQDWWLAAAAVFFGTTFAWRDTPMLHPLNMLAMLVGLALLAFGGTGSPPFHVAAAGFREYVHACVHSGFSALGGAIPLLTSDRRVDDRVEPAWLERFGSARLRAYARGTLLAIPILLAFGGLLMSADPVFGDLVRSVLSIEKLLWHAFFLAVFSWLAAGYLRGALIARQPVGIMDRPLKVRLSITESSVVLGLLNVLFALFVAVQVRYLFGGSALVHAQSGMTFAEYARRGFFELVWVSALVLPLLLILHELTERSATRDARRFRWLAGSTLALVFVVMLSALQRMRLYQLEYGLTESRLYATAFMLWLAVVFAWFAASVLRERARGFAVGSLATGWAILAGLNVMNPSAYIVRSNTARVSHTREMDARYLMSLGVDAVPATVANLDRFPLAERCAVSRRLVNRWGTPLQRRQAAGTGAMKLRTSESESSDWRTINLPRELARRTVQANADKLLSVPCPPPVKPAGRPERISRGASPG